MTVQPRALARLTLLALATALTACSSINNMLAGDKVDYRTAGAKGPGLEVPPDLTQLERDPRYQPQSGTVSATTFQQAPALQGTQLPLAAPVLAVGTTPEAQKVRLERTGDQRWVSTSLPPERLWTQLQSFWVERGFKLVVDQADVGVMETEWAENRAKIPGDIIRNTIGRVLDSLYSTGERDKFRTRVERSPDGGSEIYISHRGMVEVFTSSRQDSTVWQPRPSDPQLEAEFLQRLMVELGTPEDQARTAAATSEAPQAPRARLVPGQPQAMLQVDDNFDRAWRRVGLALDRSGFTVEDRDRSQGVYFVRYADAAAETEKPGLLGRIFSFGRREETSTLARYQVAVKPDAESSSTVSVLNAQGGADTGDVGKRIVGLLLEDLK